ncbi:hypothetical protein JF544_10730 [Halobacillus kuroshimensis]|uniref:Uncharacterized protein n=1 Tax=Halobacillus kuroshimensis TaxID=302481 RepID=A0ABS3DWK5_9BACI|nr:hypothetical protein [Halobacillus kuroshimensis]MBN8235725.1 hypothetical protein [Halobacillus kuroshimensis]
MDIIEQKYWSVYLDFLDDFQSLYYKEHSIPYLCYYRGLIQGNKGLMEIYQQKGWVSFVRNHVTDVRVVQQRFDGYKARFQKKKIRGEKKKLVLYDGYGLLRLPSSTLLRLNRTFETLYIVDREHSQKKGEKKPKVKSLDETVLVKRPASMKKTAESVLPPRYFDEYKVNVHKEVLRLQNEAKAILARKKAAGHPVYAVPYFEKALMKQIDQVVHRVEQIGALLQREGVGCVIVPYSQYMESRIFSILGAVHNVPVAALQHGIISDAFGYLPCVTDYKLVFGHYEKHWFLSRGVPEKRIVVMGHPRFDEVYKAVQTNAARIKQHIGLPIHKKNLLIIVRSNYQMKKWESFLRSLTLSDSVNLIIKDFPDHTPHYLTKKFPSTFHSKNQALSDLIQLSDAVVSYHSTAGLEGLMAGKPVFILNNNFYGYSGYFDSLGRLKQDDPVRLAGLVNAFLKNGGVSAHDQSLMQSFKQRTYPLGNGAEGRLLSFITGLIKK